MRGLGTLAGAQRHDGGGGDDIRGTLTQRQRERAVEVDEKGWVEHERTDGPEVIKMEAGKEMERSSGPCRPRRKITASRYLPESPVATTRFSKSGW